MLMAMATEKEGGAVLEDLSLFHHQLNQTLGSGLQRPVWDSISPAPDDNDSEVMKMRARITMARMTMMARMKM